MYISLKPNNQCVTTNQLDAAKTFDNRAKAENYRRCLPTSLKNLGFFVSDLAADTRPVPPSEQSTAIQQSQAVVNDDVMSLSRWQEAADGFRDFAQAADQAKQAIYAKQLAAEDRIMDILHAAEFYQLDVRRGYQLYKMLHDARVERRQCKDALCLIDSLDHATVEDLRSGRFSNCVAGFSRRKYMPRAMPELFQEADISLDHD